jgi:hypothetical protein
MTQLAFPKFPTVSNIPVINLWPMETECTLCNIHLWPPRYALPMFEGKVIESGNTFFNVCEDCYDKHEDIK